MKTNIQVNGDVYGGIHVNGGAALSTKHALPAGAPVRSSGWGVAWWCVKALVLVAAAALALCGALLALGVALTIVLVIVGVVLGFYLLCRVGQFLLIVESELGGSLTRPVGVSTVMRALGPGARVNELAELKRESHYVDSN